MVLGFDDGLEVDRRATEAGGSSASRFCAGNCVTAVTDKPSVSSTFVSCSWGAQMLVYEDNFGFLDITEPEERAFFDFVRRQSVLTACERCERPVRLIPPKALCASCVSALEYGAPASMKEYGSQETLLDSARPS